MMSTVKRESKKTPQDWFYAYKQAYESMPDDAQELFYKPPATWEEVGELEKAAFAIMAWKGNLVLGEMFC